MKGQHLAPPSLWLGREPNEEAHEFWCGSWAPGCVLGCAWRFRNCGAQTPLERGRYLVDTVMTCHNCHTPRGPNGFQFDKALSGGV
jgi:hypothetical protein